MHVKTLSTRSRRKTLKTVKLQVGKFIVTNKYTNDRLTDQLWSTPATWCEPMYFKYYEDISFLDSEFCLNSSRFRQSITRPSLVKDWARFKGFNHVLSINLAEGIIYKIDDPKPVILWRSVISNFSYDKPEVNRFCGLLKRKTWTRNVKPVEMFYGSGLAAGNREWCVQFEYRLRSQEELHKKLKQYSGWII